MAQTVIGAASKPGTVRPLGGFMNEVDTMCNTRKERLVVRGLTREFGPGVGVFGVDLTISEGQIHALVGLNGAGKTTLMRLILTMLRPSAGTVNISGRNVATLPNERWRSVGQLIEQPFLYPELDVSTSLRLAAMLRCVPSELVSSTVDSIIDELDLVRYRSVKARRLSQGNRQRVGIAAALQHAPELLILDEPTNALDPAGVILLREALRRRASQGAGVLVSSHHLDEVARIAHRISVINHGRLIGTISPQGTDIERQFFSMVHGDDERSHR